MARFDLTDFEWSVIAPLLPNKPRGVPRPARVERNLLAAADRRAVGRYSRALRPAYHLREPLQPLAQGRRLGSVKQYQRLTMAISR